MFRRREDEASSTDSETGSAQSSFLGSNFSEAASVVSPERSASASPSTASAATPASTYQVGSAARAATAETARAATPTASAASTGFRATPMAQPDLGRPRAPEAKPAAPAAYGMAATGKDSRRVLTVGADILLKGEIATCDRLVIEGKVDAVLNDVGTVELAESGSFKGVAHVENAEISGLFEGELVVKGRLVIYASGKVRGKIAYGEIEIQRGGELTGEIKTVSSSQGSRPPGRAERSSKEDSKVAA